MLAISPLRNTHDAIDGGRQQLQSVVVDGGDVHGLQGFSADDNFSDMAFSGAGCSILDGIDFDDLFVGFGDGDDVDLPDLEVDPNEIAPDFSVDGSADESGGGGATASSGGVDGLHDGGGGLDAVSEETSSVAPAAAFQGGGGEDGGAQLMQAEGMELEDDDAVTNGAPPEDAAAVADQYQPAQQLEETSPAGSADEMQSDGAGRKPSSSAQAKGPNGKRKVKVDWTPELHRRFVQAVEQLGIDKAVPSRILELMGIDCLTRHNIASHLQKYRSHRKHLMTREAEAATWSQRRHIYGAPAAGKRDPMAGAGAVAASAPWLQAPPTLGFPPAPHPHPSVQPFRPLHVWGHPTVDHAMVHMWPKHLVPPPGGRPSPPWAAAPPPSAAFWHYPRGMPNPLTQGTPCFSPAPMPQSPISRFPAAQPVAAGIPPPPPHTAAAAAAGSTMYSKQEGGALPIPANAKHLHFDLQPSKESIDAALGDVLSKPWLPLPLGLKPPSVDSVLVELQRQGISKIPPSCA